MINKNKGQSKSSKKRANKKKAASLSSSNSKIFLSDSGYSGAEDSKLRNRQLSSLTSTTASTPMKAQKNQISPIAITNQGSNRETMNQSPLISPNTSNLSFSSLTKSASSSGSSMYIDPAEAAEADSALDSIFLKWARRYPAFYLKFVSHLLVMTELVAMMTPAVAMGIQWVTALCQDKPPVEAIIDLVILLWTCISSGGNCDLQNSSHCILKSSPLVNTITHNHHNGFGL